MATPWEREDVSRWPVQSVEQAGSGHNEWLVEPGSGRLWLHKDTTIQANGDEQGEDWAEVVSTQVAVHLGVPCATALLCTRQGRRGSLSLSVVPHGNDLWEGAVVLEANQAPGYFRHLEGSPGVDPTRPKIKRPGHSLTNIHAALKSVAAPPNFDGPDDLTGFDVFAGYMILDALIANRDRHEQNWAVLAPALMSDVVRLSPSYDHARGLGCNLPDSKRERYLGHQALLRAWANRGTAYRFEHSGTPPTLVSHAAKSLDLCTPRGANWWQERITDCALGPVQEALRDHAIPEMSVIAAKFASDLLELNLRRIRHAVHQRS